MKIDQIFKVLTRYSAPTGKRKNTNNWRFIWAVTRTDWTGSKLLLARSCQLAGVRNFVSICFGCCRLSELATFNLYETKFSIENLRKVYGKNTILDFLLNKRFQRFEFHGKLIWNFKQDQNIKELFDGGDIHCST